MLRQCMRTASDSSVGLFYKLARTSVDMDVKIKSIRLVNTLSGYETSTCAGQPIECSYVTLADAWDVALNMFNWKMKRNEFSL